MKKNWILIALMLALIASFSSCKPSKPKTENIRIGLCLYQQEDTFITRISTEFQKLAGLSETSAKKITVKVLDAKGNQSLQNEQVDRLIASQYDVICVNIVDRTAASVLIDRAKSSNIPIVFFNREPVKEDLNRWEKAYYVGATASESGMLQGQMVLDAISQNIDAVDKNKDGKIQYVMMEGELGHQDAMLRTEFSVKVLTAAGIKVEKLGSESAQWQRGQAETKMAQWLEQQGNVFEVVFSNNDDMALGAIDAYKKHYIKVLPIIVGVDGNVSALEAVKSGDLFGTVLNDGEAQADVMLRLCLSLSSKDIVKKIPNEFKNNVARLPYKAVTEDNIDKFIQ